MRGQSNYAVADASVNGSLTIIRLCCDGRRGLEYATAMAMASLRDSLGRRATSQPIPISGYLIDVRLPRSLKACGLRDSFEFDENVRLALLQIPDDGTIAER